MKLGFLRAKLFSELASPTADARFWRFGPSDYALAAGMLTLVVAVSLPVALRFRHQAAALERERAQLSERCQVLAEALGEDELRRELLTRVRREANRCVSEVEARPIVPWTTIVSELSRRRPRGLRTLRISGDGPRFRAHVLADSPELATQYAQRLMQSPYVDFAALPGGAAGRRTQILGRLTGE
jgi:hypothetical protein